MDIMAKRSQTVEEYVADRSAPVRATLDALRELVKATLPKTTEGMKWGAPVYLSPDGEPIVYLYGGKDHANLGFLNGAELSDPDELLEGRGKATRIIEICAADAIPRKAIRRFLRESAKLARKPS